MLPRQLKNLVLLLVVSSTSISSTAVAAKGGNGGGGSPPPPTCGTTEKFPGFVISTEATKKSASQTFVVGADGCRKVLLSNNSFSAMHMSDPDAQGTTRGIIVWSEDNNNQYIVIGMLFNTDAVGNVTVGPQVQILPYYGEEPTSSQYSFYFSLDLWGNADHY